MTNSKTIFIIHTDDAVQHLGHLTKILEDLKNEDRISGFKSMDADSFTGNPLNDIGEEDMVILLLTDGLSPVKSTIEEALLKFKQRQSSTKIAEVLVDNLPYELEFIAFPADLQPIRSREDMDTVWGQIGENLRDMFPKIEDPVPTSPWKKWVPYILGAIVLATVVIVFLVKPWGTSPQADFSYRVLDPTGKAQANAETCYIPCQILLTDRSKNAESLVWKIQDTAITDNAEPDYVFIEPGKHVISLTASNGKKQDVITKSIEFKAPPYAGFEIVNNGCTADCDVSFKNTSENVTKFHWTFEGTSPSSSSDKDPGKRRFTGDGKFKISLHVENEDGIKADTVQEVTILRDNAPFADFTVKQTGGGSSTRQTFKFTSTSKNANQFKWDWGDGTPNGTGATANHTFNGYGNYAVTLTVRGGAGNLTNDTFRNVLVRRYNILINETYKDAIFKQMDVKTIPINKLKAMKIKNFQIPD